MQPDGGEDQSGKVNAGDPKLFTVTVGGKSAGRGGKHSAPRVRQRNTASPDQQDEDEEPEQQQGEAPPIPPNKPQQGKHEGGWKEKMHGFADKILK